MKSGKIKRSYDRFSYYADSLVNSDYDTFLDRLNLFMDFCKKDPVLSIVHDQLINEKAIDFDEWYEERKKTMGGMVGSGQLSFPSDIDSRMALMYQLLQKVNEGEVDVLSLSRCFFAVGTRLDEHISALNSAVTEPLMQELRYKFEDVIDDLPDNDKQEVNPAVIQFIGSAENVVQQNVQGDNNTVIANSYNAELDKKFSDLKGQIEENFYGSEKEDYLQAIDVAEESLKRETPRVKPAELLLKSLPNVGSVASIVASIMTIVSG